MWLLGLIILVLAIWLAISLLDGGEGDMTPPADDEPIEQQDVQPDDPQQEPQPEEQSEAQPPIEDAETAEIGLVLTAVTTPANEGDAVGRIHVTTAG